MSLLETTIAGQRRGNGHAQVVDELGRAIVSGRYEVGSILPGDDELCAHFGFSRTVLREAMKTLAAKNLVQPKARVGTRILEKSRWNLFDSDVLAWRFEAGLDEDLLVHLGEIRAAFEPEAAALAARRADPADVARLYEIARRLADPSHNKASIAKVDLEFHLAIAEVSKNPFMLSISSLIEAALAISFKLSSPASDPVLISECAANHLAIVDAIAAGDERATRAAMLTVIGVGVDRTRRALRLGS
ncbi:GntR family transcriptional regulator [Aureimonas endophytica]|uniref:GntR family transcriptional regulator n=1 Tax=Aureimonas endophytica TaxID=2027858 RepID=A0A916ZH91_9HYPH|nr:FadR/GntR family transcriptional regulator [Aureimonas endophytica]GGD97858.1 GntR family transcriptional regulator [Aureimonas endophytica]